MKGHVFCKVEELPAALPCVVKSHKCELNVTSELFAIAELRV